MRLYGTLLTSDNQKISYKHYKCGHKEVIIIAHGFFNSKDAALLIQLKDALIEDYDVIMFDFRGHGRSSGLFSWTSREDLDLETVLAYAQKEYGKIGLIAFSLGAAISISVLAKDDIVDSFIAVSAPSEFEKIDYHFWNADFKDDILYTFVGGNKNRGVRPGAFWHKKPRPIDLIEKVKAPILYIHGEKDWVIRYQHSQRLFQKTQAKKSLEIIKNGSHAEYLLRKNPEIIVDMMKDWFKETL